MRRSCVGYLGDNLRGRPNNGLNYFDIGSDHVNGNSHHLDNSGSGRIEAVDNDAAC